MAQSKSEAYLKWLNTGDNRAQKNAKKREWNAKNKERIKAYKQIYRTPEVKAAEYSKHKEWLKKNPDKIKTYYKSSVQKLRNDPAGLIRKQIRRIIYVALKSKSKTSDSLSKLIGCSKQEFKNQLEQKFKDGMNWDNYGSYWQVDHIKPLILFDVTNESEYRICSHYSNLQPLLTVENLKKGIRYGKN